MDLMKRVIEVCEVSSPEKEIPVEVRKMPPKGVTEKVIENPIPFSLLLAIRRGGTFNR